MTRAWLPQLSPGTGAALLCDHPGPMVQIAGFECHRADRYALPTLVRRHGPAAGLPDVLATLSADCPRQIAGQLYDICDAHYPDLGGRASGGGA